ncbi:cellulose synthase/poly-beta-1,6-N-acetylglucosamine synthase-like glycosyltransferase [Lachnospiraceae bacterium PF1-21]
MTRIKRVNSLKRTLFNMIFLYLLPTTTIMITAASWNKSYESLTISIIPIMLIIWFVSLMISVLYSIIGNSGKSERMSVGRIVFYCTSTAFWMMCCFVVLFSRSILLGGFHAS